MHVNPAERHSSFVSPLLFGRSTQLDMLRSALKRTRGGVGITVLVTGDAGVGKSRLIASAGVDAIENGFQVLEAGCFEPDASVPYAPLLELLAPGAVAMATAAAELAGFVADPNGEPEQERHRLFVALTQYCSGLSDVQPLVLIVEDIHWCDQTSLQFLRYLARHIATRRIALLLSYRVDLDETAPSLEHAVAELERTRLAIEMRVNPLSRADLELMAGAILSPRTSFRAEFVDGVFGLTRAMPSSLKRSWPYWPSRMPPCRKWCWTSARSTHCVSRGACMTPSYAASRVSARQRNEWHVWGPWLDEGSISPSCRP
jgi:predicted ATPase